MIVKEFSCAGEFLEETKERKQTSTKHKNMIKLVGKFINNKSKVLDVGERNPFTSMIEDRFNIKVDNTIGDLDVDFKIPKKNYDVIVCSHVIEHIFNPLSMLLNLRKVLKDGFLILALPQRTKLLWTKGHFHEIDDYRIRILFKRAGFEVIEKQREKVKRNWWTYFFGIRSFLRLFFEYNSIYILKKINRIF